jgi:TRAP transporter 4TM/12TM fusion protein
MIFMDENKHKSASQLLQAFAVFFYASYTTIFLYTSYFGRFQYPVQTSLFVGGGLIILFIGDAVSGKSVTWQNVVLSVVVALAIVMTMINTERYLYDPITLQNVDIVLGLVFITTIFIGAKKIIGTPIVILAAISVAYAIFGHLLPGYFHHSLITFRRYMSIMQVSNSGLWGFVAQIIGGTVTPYVIFGSVLLSTGGCDTLTKLVLYASRSLRGGPAKIAVISSSLLGMINGAPASNVAVTGSMTIPLMKQTGYPAETAGAIEAVASSGGQLIPPIMGASAFIMPQYITGATYRDVALAAVIPAILYVVGCFCYIHFISVKHGYGNLDKSIIPSREETFIAKDIIFLLIPIVIIFTVIFKGYTPELGAFYATMACLAMFVVRNGRREAICRLKKLVGILSNAGLDISKLAIIAGAVQLIIPVIGTTGIGIKVSDTIYSMGNSTLLGSLVLSAVLSTILGMGMPTTAAYVLTAAIIAPSLVSLGVNQLATHLFLFYYAIMAGLTPPVCTVVYVAAGMAGANWVKCGFESVKMAIVAYLVPFMFVYNPALLMQGNVWEILWCALTGAVGAFSMAVGLTGYEFRQMGIFSRVTMIAGAVLLIAPERLTDIVGLILVIIPTMLQVAKMRVPRD